MGQYYYICNIDKHEFLHPHKFGDGLKLLEFGASGEGTMLGLAYLLADGNGRGGGDIYSRETDKPRHFSGSWAGDRIVVTGDYADPKYIPHTRQEECNLFDYAQDHYRDISDEVILEIKSVEPRLFESLDLNSTGWREKTHTV